MTMNKLLLALVLGAFLCTSGFAQSWKGELGGIAGVNFGALREGVSVWMLPGESTEKSL